MLMQKSITVCSFSAPHLQQSRQQRHICLSPTYCWFRLKSFKAEGISAVNPGTVLRARGLGVDWGSASAAATETLRIINARAQPPQHCRTDFCSELFQPCSLQLLS